MRLQDKILVTGFEPFGADTRNPSAELAQVLEGEVFCGLQVVALRLPCVFEVAPGVLDAAVQQTRPRIVLALGQAAGRSGLAIERVAINLMDAPIPDNAGDQPSHTAIDPDGPAAYFSTLPILAMLAAVHAAGVPANLSLSAGSYVCNRVFYGLLHHLALRRLRIPAGFLHLPLLPEQVAERCRREGSAQPLASLDFDTQLRGLRAALGAAAGALQDLRTDIEPEGTPGATGQLH